MLNLGVKNKNNGKKSRKLLFVATTITILALSSVLAVYAAVLLGTFTGGTVTVGGVVTGTPKYSSTTDGPTGDWQLNLQIVSLSTPWYTKLDLNAGYSGRVEVIWLLESDASGLWTDVTDATITTYPVLSGDGQAVYANQNWATFATEAGSYRVIAVVNSAPL